MALSQEPVSTRRRVDAFVNAITPIAYCNSTAAGSEDAVPDGVGYRHQPPPGHGNCVIRDTAAQALVRFGFVC